MPLRVGSRVVEVHEPLWAYEQLIFGPYDNAEVMLWFEDASMLAWSWYPEDGERAIFIPARHRNSDDLEGLLRFQIIVGGPNAAARTFEVEWPE